MNTWELGLTAAAVIYIAMCIGRLAARNDKNPFLYGLLSIISPVNLIILGIWSFSDPQKTRGQKAG